MNTPNGPPRSPARWMRFFAARLDRDSYLGLHLTVGLIVISAGVWLFGALLDEILDNSALVHWDLATSTWIHSTTTPLGIRIFELITNIGSPVAMASIAIVGAVTMFMRKHRLLAYAWAAAAAGGAILDWVLKTTVHRSRPEYAAAFLHGSSYSFPSGHAMGSMIGYGFLAYTIVVSSKRVGWHRRMIFVLAASLTLLIGISRIYLGVHYPSDVVGGWAAGLAWLAVCVTGYQLVTGRSTLRNSLNPSSTNP